MATRMQQRRGTAAQWTGANPILAAGEIGFETDTGKFKIGNGSSTWSALNYYVDANAILDGAPGVLDTLNELAAALGDDPAFITTVATNLSNHASDTSNVHGIVNTANLATLDDVADAVSNAEVDQSTLAGEGIDWNVATSQFDIDSTVVTLTGTQTLTNKTLDSAELGSSTATTQNGTDSTTKVATTEFVQGRINAIVAGAPELLNTLSELSSAIANDQDFAVTITGLVGEKVAKAGDTMTGILTLSGTPTEPLHAATKGYADNLVNSHNDLTQNIHGIANTGDLATQSYVNTTSGNAANGAVGTHNGLTQNVHGITDTGLLATESYADTAASNAASGAVGTHNVLTENVHGIGNTLDLATKSYADDAADNAVEAHRLVTTNIHGILDTADLVLTDDARLSDTRTPTDNTVTTAKIVDSNITADKLAADSVTEAKVADGAITSGKIAEGTIVNSDISDSAAIAQSKVSGLTTDLAAKAPLADPTFTGTVSGITKSMVGLGNVDNTSDADKPVSTAQAAAIATAKSEAIADATAQVNAVIASAPAALNTLDELAAALGDDANFATTVTNSLATKAPLASPTFTGTVTVAASGIAFTDGTQTKEGVPSRTPIIQKTAAYTLGALTERDSLIEVSHTGASAVNVTIPADSTLNFPIGTSIDVLQTSTGSVAIAAGAGVTVNATPGLTLRTQWSSATLLKRAANTWVVYGDLK